MRYIYKTIYSLGLHIGNHSFLTKTENYKFLIGYRKGISIIDVNLLYYQIKKSVLFLNKIGELNGFLLFYYSNIDRCPFYLKLFLLNAIYYSNNHGFIHSKWTYGLLSNSFTHMRYLISNLFYLDVKGGTNFTQKDKKIKKKYKAPIHVGYDIVKLLYRILFFTLSKRLDGMEWLETLESVKNYWRLLDFFKYYSFIKSHPDCFICLNNTNIYNPILEAQYLKIPSVLVTSDSANTNNSSYLVMSGNKSNITNVFYVMLFLFSYQIGKYKKYNSI